MPPADKVRASQFPTEAVEGTLPPARVSQFITEAVHQETAEKERISQFVVEAIHQENADKLRVSQLPAETVQGRLPPFRVSQMIVEAVVEVSNLARNRASVLSVFAH